MKLRPGQIAQAGAADGDVLTWDDTAGEWVAAAGGGGGGGTSAPFYFAQSTAGTVVNPAPTSMTLVNNLTLTIPTSGVTRTAIVTAQVADSGSHAMRCRILLDGTAVYPDGATGIQAGTTRVGSSANNVYEWILAGLPLTLSSGSSHTIEVHWNASDATTSVTIMNGFLGALVFSGTSSPGSI